MRPGKLSLRCVAFDATTFEELIADLCPGLNLEDGTPDQVRYLASYLQHAGLRVQTLVIEEPYVDRHYLEEFRQYYSTAFQPPRSYTARVHVFAGKFDDEGLEEVFRKAFGPDGGVSAIQNRFQSEYVGFFVVRPLPSAPIGRTILSPYEDLPTRVFPSAQTHRVHICGVELTVSGVPFQQQEVAVGACATTAIWSALASVSRATGSRGPTPSQVTEAATQHVLNDRRFPAQSGLELQQVVAAINSAGFAPHMFKACDDSEPFGFALKTYLASGIPVVLILHEELGYHAVTAVGYRDADDNEGADDLRLELGDPTPLVTGGFARVYVHEDRLGPYARMTWTSGTEDSAPALAHAKHHAATYDYGNGPMGLYAAVVPLYRKVRLSARGLLMGAAELLPLVRMVLAEEQREHIRVDARFLLSGQYLSEIYTLGEHLLQFVMTAALPRYVGIVRYSIRNVPIMDAVFDSTDIFRKSPKYGSVLSLVPLHAPYAEEFAKFADTLPCNQENPSSAAAR